MFLTLIRKYSWIFGIAGIIIYLYVNIGFAKYLYQFGAHNGLPGFLTVSFFLSFLICLLIWSVFSYAIYLSVHIVNPKDNLSFFDILSLNGLGAFLLIIIAGVEFFFQNRIKNELLYYITEKTTVNDLLSFLSSNDHVLLIQSLNNYFPYLLVLWCFISVYILNGHKILNALLSIALPLVLILSILLIIGLRGCSFTF